MGNPIFRRGLRAGIGAAIEHRELLSTLDVLTVVDIGANVGQFALLALVLYPRARIVSFEPLVGPAKKYTALMACEPRVQFHRVAIAPQAGMRQMHVSAHDDSSSLLPILESQVAFAPGTQEVGREDVILAPLDKHLSAESIVTPALLKLDVQGYELEALKGCETLLSRFDYVYVETSFFPLYGGQVLAGELIEWLAAHRFRIDGACNPSYSKDGRIVQMDVLFKR